MGGKEREKVLPGANWGTRRRAEKSPWRKKKEVFPREPTRVKQPAGKGSKEYRQGPEGELFQIPRRGPGAKKGVRSSETRNIHVRATEKKRMPIREPKRQKVSSQVKACPMARPERNRTGKKEEKRGNLSTQKLATCGKKEGSAVGKETGGRLASKQYGGKGPRIDQGEPTSADERGRKILVVGRGVTPWGGLGHIDGGDEGRPNENLGLVYYFSGKTGEPKRRRKKDFLNFSEGKGRELCPKRKTGEGARQKGSGVRKMLGGVERTFSLRGKKHHPEREKKERSKRDIYREGVVRPQNEYWRKGQAKSICRPSSRDNFKGEAPGKRKKKNVYSQPLGSACGSGGRKTRPRPRRQSGMRSARQRVLKGTRGHQWEKKRGTTFPTQEKKTVHKTGRHRATPKKGIRGPEEGARERRHGRDALKEILANRGEKVRQERKVLSSLAGGGDGARGTSTLAFNSRERGKPGLLSIAVKPLRNKDCYVGPRKEGGDVPQRRVTRTAPKSLDQGVERKRRYLQSDTGDARRTGSA